MYVEVLHNKSEHGVAEAFDDVEALTINPPEVHIENYDGTSTRYDLSEVSVQCSPNEPASLKKFKELKRKRAFLESQVEAVSAEIAALPAAIRNYREDPS